MRGVIFLEILTAVDQRRSLRLLFLIRWFHQHNMFRFQLIRRATLSRKKLWNSICSFTDYWIFGDILSARILVFPLLDQWKTTLSLLGDIEIMQIWNSNTLNKFLLRLFAFYLPWGRQINRKCQEIARTSKTSARMLAIFIIITM